MHDQPAIRRASSRTAAQQLVEMGRSLLQVVLPRNCVACGGRPLAEQAFCRACLEEMLGTSVETPAPVACRRCARPQLAAETAAELSYDFWPVDCPGCRSEKWPFEETIAIGPYEGLLGHLIVEAKSAIRAPLAEGLGRLIATRHAARFNEHDLSQAAVVPITAHWRRRLGREGQSPDYLAKGLAAGLGIPCVRALSRTRYVPKQTEVTASERQRNVRRSFGLRQKERIAGRTLFLVDDVLTTGSTATAASRVLLQAGADRVVVVVAAGRVGVT